MSFPSQTAHLRILRRAPIPGEIGHPGTCPLCMTTGASASSPPPCLACREEIRARLLDMAPVAMTDLVLN